MERGKRGEERRGAIKQQHTAGFCMARNGLDEAFGIKACSAAILRKNRDGEPQLLDTTAACLAARFDCHERANTVYWNNRSLSWRMWRKKWRRVQISPSHDTAAIIQQKRSQNGQKGEKRARQKKKGGKGCNHTAGLSVAHACAGEAIRIWTSATILRRNLHTENFSQNASTTTGCAVAYRFESADTIDWTWS